MEGSLSCTLCKGLLEEPKELPCKHIFCARCIKNRISKENFLSCVTCGVQKQYMIKGGIDDLPTNQRYQKLVERFLQHVGEKQSTPQCNFCRRDAATFLCENCNTILCSVCQLPHQKAGHFVVAIGVSDSRLCNVHYSEVDRYCVTCDKVVCPRCALEDHNHHRTEKVHEAAPSCRAQIEVRQRSLEDLIHRVEGTVSSIRDTQEGLDIARRATEERLDKDYRAVVNALELELSKRKRALETICEAKHKILSEQLDEYTRIRETLSSSVGFSQEMILHWSNVEFLLVWSKVLESMKELKSKYSHYGYLCHETPLIESTEGIVPDLTRALGEVVVHPNPKAFKAEDGIQRSCIIKGQELQFAITCTDIYATVLSYKELPELQAKMYHEGNGEEIMCHIIRNGVGTYTVKCKAENVGTYQIKVSAISSDAQVVEIMDPLHVKVTPSVHKQEVRFNVFGKDPKLKPQAISMNKDFIILSDSERHQLVVYDRNFLFQRTIGCKGSGILQFDSPQGTTFNLDGNILVADKNNHRIQLVSIAGAFIWSFVHPGSGREGPVSVAVNKQGIIFVADSRGVQYFDDCGTFLGMITNEDVTSMLPTIACPSIAIDMYGRLLVTSPNLSNVYIFQKNQTNKYALTSKFEGLLTCPATIACDHNYGYVYVADNSKTPRVAVFSAQGEYLTSYNYAGSKTFSALIGICVDQNGVMVLLDNSGQVLQFEILDKERDDVYLVEDHFAS